MMEFIRDKKLRVKQRRARYLQAPMLVKYPGTRLHCTGNSVCVIVLIS